MKPASQRSGVPHARSVTTPTAVSPYVYALLFGIFAWVLHERFFPIGDPDVETDFYGDLVLAAKKLLRGEFSVHNYPFKGPVYSLVLVLVGAIRGDLYRGATLLNAACSAGTLILAYRIVRRDFAPPIALSAMIFVSLILEFTIQAHRASTDLLFLLLSLAAVAAAGSRERGAWRAAIAGGLAGLAFLTRYIGAFLCLALPLLVVLSAERPARRPKWRHAGLVVGGFVLVTGPWFGLNLAEAGRFLATQNLQNLVEGIYGGVRWQHLKGDITDLGLLIGRDPLHFAGSFLGNILAHRKQDMTQLLGFPAAALVLAGAASLLVAPPTRRQWSLYAVFAIYAMCMGGLFYDERFFLLLTVPYATLAVAPFFGGVSTRRTRLGRRVGIWLGRVANAGRLRTRRNRLVCTWSLLGAVFFYQALAVVRSERILYHGRPLYLLDAAAGLRRHAAHSGLRRVMARKGHVAYYAGLEYVGFPRYTRSLQDLLHHAHENGADYLVYSSIERAMVPHLRIIADMDTVPGLQEIFRQRAVRVFVIQKQEHAPVVTDEDNIRMLERNIRLAMDEGDPVMVCRAYYQLTSYLLSLNRHSEAGPLFEESLRIAESIPVARRQRFAVEARHNLALIYLLSGRHAEAIPLLETNVVEFEALGTDEDLAMTEDLLWRHHLQLGHVVEATDHLRRAISLYRSSGNALAADSLQTVVGKIGTGIGP